jgi:hypothetical protein
VAVGANLVDHVTDNTGAVYLFERHQDGAGAWGPVRKVTLTTNLNDQLGISVALEGDLLAAGAYRVDDLINDGGLAYLFERNTGGTNQWGLVNRFGAGDAFSGARLGESVSLSGTELVAGAAFDGRLATRAGAAYVFAQPTDPPDLFVEHSGGLVTVWWAPPTAGFVLQRTAALRIDPWEDVIVGPANAITFPATNTPAFFRMIKR